MSKIRPQWSDEKLDLIKIWQSKGVSQPFLYPQLHAPYLIFAIDNRISSGQSWVFLRTPSADLKARTLLPSKSEQELKLTDAHKICNYMPIIYTTKCEAVNLCIKEFFTSYTWVMFINESLPFRFVWIYIL